MGKILVLVAGRTNKFERFIQAAEKLGVDLTLESFSAVKFLAETDRFELTINDRPLDKFSLIYMRLVGRRSEDAALCLSYAAARGIRVIDHADPSTPLIYPKSLETMKLVEAGIPMPKTIFAKLDWIRKAAENELGFPFVIKQTDSKRSMGIWSPRTHSELDELVNRLKELELQGRRFLAQEFVEAGQRERILVIGKQAAAGVVRSMQFRKRFIEKINGEFPPRVKKALNPILPEDADLAVRAAKVLGIEIAGVDIIHEDKTGKAYVLEVNSAPRWNGVQADNPQVNIEEEIVKYLANLASKGETF